MVIDTSALLAILFDEPERPAFTRLIAADPVRLVSAVSRVETAMVVTSRKGEPGRKAMERLMAEAEITTEAVTGKQGEIALAAFLRFGKGQHRAALNLGDIFAYALARDRGEPLLFKGEDFAATDIEPAR